MITLKEGAEEVFEPSPYCQFVLQDGDDGPFWNGRANPSSPAAWTKDLSKAKIIVGLQGIVETRKTVSPIVEYDQQQGTVAFRKTRVTYFRELEQPATKRAVA